MARKVERTALIALGTGTIVKGSEMIGAGNYVEGITAITAGVVVVYGYHVVEDWELDDAADDLSRVSEAIPGKDNEFDCGICGEPFDTEKGLNTHKGMVHSEEKKG